jgi:ABC transport system ATP-binding/permease protein
MEAIAWLEELLVESNMAIIFITHDRRFLERVGTRIVELDRGRLASFDCGFSEYQQRKAQLLYDESILNRKFDKLLKEEEVWIRKGVEARRTRAVYRVQRLHALRDERAQRRDRMGRVSLQIDAGEKSGQMVAQLEHVNKSFGSKTIVRDFSCRIMRGDRVGVIGPNGAGKTTLLKIVLGELEADSGQVKRGTRQTVAYFDQFREALDPEAALADVISPGSDFVEIGNERKHVIGYLGEFLFPPQRARSPVKSLSGGERNRLLLARLFARPANVLVLDEPTNDLDIDTLELLEQLLLDYPGTLFLVSHDRAFLDNVVTQVISAEGEGIWLENAGGYDDWLVFKTRRQREIEKERSLAKPTSTTAKQGAQSTQTMAKPAKLTFKEQKELEGLPAKIAALEQQQGTLTARLENPATYGNSDEAHKIAARMGVIEAELNLLMDRWVALEARSAA